MSEKLVEYSFYLTYAFLVTTGTITFIEAIRTKNDSMRHILNLETCISIVAAFFYGKFVTEFDKPVIDYKEINLNRYVDWAITTPIMLLVLILAFKYNSTNNAQVKFTDYLIILVLNYGMLGSGYMGDLGKIDRLSATIIGFLFFGGLYFFLYNTYLRQNKSNQLLYGIFFVLWSLYGVFYQMEQKARNIGYNILDLFSKCFVGIYFWAYFTKIFN
jgi:bacteriorhodopsin|tara:strand:+ start:2290 stop:2937 length:648 start_codon:yes stop_codon:yes gene_type:complete